MIVFSTFLLFVLTVDGYIHTPEEAKHIDEICGLFPDVNKKTFSIGGREADPKEAPHVVALTYRGSPMCTGSLISDRFVLTAAHCFLAIGVFFKPYATLERIKTNMKPFIDHGFIVVHPKNSGNFDNATRTVGIRRVYTQTDGILSKFDADFVLVELVEIVQFDKFTIPVCLPKEASPLKTHLELFGYGDNLIPGKKHDLFKLETILEECSGHTGLIINIDSSCARFPGRSACGGDSGGGLIRDLNGRKHIVATVSRGSRDCTQYDIDYNTELANYNVDIHTHMPWICRYTGLCQEKDYPEITVGEQRFQRQTVIIERSRSME